MRYTVIWKQEALDELTAVWLASSDRQGVTEASHRIDQALAINPDQQGESRGGPHRVLFDSPLAVVFQVDEQDRKVCVLHLWAIR